MELQKLFLCTFYFLVKKYFFIFNSQVLINWFNYWSSKSWNKFCQSFVRAPINTSSVLKVWQYIWSLIFICYLYIVNLLHKINLKYTTFCFGQRETALHSFTTGHSYPITHINTHVDILHPFFILVWRISSNSGIQRRKIIKRWQISHTWKVNRRELVIPNLTLRACVMHFLKQTVPNWSCCGNWRRLVTRWTRLYTDRYRPSLRTGPVHGSSVFLIPQ